MAFLPSRSSLSAGRSFRSLCVLAVLLLPGRGFASRFIELRQIDQDILMIYFKDGEVFYTDDGQGPTAFLGHAHGEDELVAYGEELDVEVAADPASWRIYSADDERFGAEGVAPVKVFRKAKVNNSDHEWNYKLDHWFFLQLPHSLRQGCTYRVAIAEATHSDVTEARLTFDAFSSVSEAVHVNIIGYMQDGPVKSADLYSWLGDGGARDYTSFEGNAVYIVDVKTGEPTKVGEVSFYRKSAVENGQWNLVGSDVWNADFSDFSRAGRYRLAIEGVGCSPEFEIRNDIYREPLRTSIRGYYYMRIGEKGEGMTPVPRRPLFIPGKDPEGFTIFLTDLHPYHELWDKIPGDTWDEPHFKPAEESIFWRHRLPGSPTNPNAVGGLADAMDWDRHLGHVSNIYDLLLSYFLTDGGLADDDFGIPESGNGIPDIIDEARNEVDFWLTVRDGEAYCHGITNPSRDKTCMFQAGKTTMAAWANAANCAMLADCFRLSGHDELRAYYQAEAERAFAFAGSQDNQQLDDIQDVGSTAMRGRDFRMMAAAFLYNLTGESAYEEVVAGDTVAISPISEIEKQGAWAQIWGTAAYLKTPHRRSYPEVAENMRRSILREARNKCVQGMQTRPSRRSSTEDWFQTMAQVQRLILAHAVCRDAADKAVFEKALMLEADWGLGRNPMNRVEMTGLGSRCIENCYTTGGDDGTPGLHPGHTPYLNLEPWGTRWNGANPRWFSDRGYPDWDEGGWPYQEAYFNSRYSWANGEFTPQQTMRGKTAMYAYLHALGKAR